ncbi:MAG: EF-hand domain-containing protein [Thermoguttaceae bacterium]
MAKTAINPTLHTLIVLLAAVAGILACAIYVAANSPARSRAEAALAEANKQAEEARKDAAERIETLQQKNAELRKQLELAKANLDQRAEKLAAAEQNALRLRGDLDAAFKKMAELSQKCTEALDAERKAKLDVDAMKRAPAVTVIQAPAAENEAIHAGNKNRSQKNGTNNNFAGRRRGPVASLPRTSPSFSELDTNHDGRLTLDEYKVGFPDAVNVEEEFKALDTNGDGTLSIDEYKAGHPDPPVVSTKRARRN